MPFGLLILCLSQTPETDDHDHGDGRKYSCSHHRGFMVARMPTTTYLVHHFAAGEEKFKFGRGRRWAGPEL